MLGIGRPGETFRCVLPGHDHDAEVVARGDGIWQYKCPGAKPLPLARVRALLAGRANRPSDIELCRWLERLDYEAGVLRARREVALRVDAEWTPATITVAHHLEVFIALRDDRLHGQPFPFAREFCWTYCGVSDEQARRAMGTLEREGVIVRVDDHLRRPKDPIMWSLPEWVHDSREPAGHRADDGVTGQRDGARERTESPPCPHAEHRARARDWEAVSGRVCCGVCHPPLADNAVTRWLPGSDDYASVTQDTMSARAEPAPGEDFVLASDDEEAIADRLRREGWGE